MFLMKVAWLPILIISSLFISNSLVAQDQIELLFTGANPDYKPFESTYGYSITGEYDFSSGLFLSGFYNETNFLASGSKVGNVNVQSWLETGIGYAFDHEWGQFYSLLTFESIAAEHRTYEGFGAHFGYRKDWATNWSTVLQLGYLDTDFHDFQLQAKVNYKIADNFAITVGLRDYANWDYTSYEAGLVYRY